MGDIRVARGRIKKCLVRTSVSHGFGHFVIGFQNDPFGSVFAVYLFILAFNDWEGLHDVIDGIAGRWELVFELDKILRLFIGKSTFGNSGGFPIPICCGGQVKVEKGGIEFAADDEPTVRVPMKRGALTAMLFCKRS